MKSTTKALAEFLDEVGQRLNDIDVDLRRATMQLAAEQVSLLYSIVGKRLQEATSGVHYAIHKLGGELSTPIAHDTPHAYDEGPLKNLHCATCGYAESNTNHDPKRR